MSQENLHISDELLVKFLMEETSQEENALVANWLRSGEEARIYLQQMREAWEHSRKLEYGGSVDENRAWQQFQERISNHKKASRFPWLSIAALFILVLSAVWLLVRNEIHDPGQSIAVQSGNQVLVDTLTDGSIITLNKNSAITYDQSFNKDSRKIVLKGEAFFDVEPDKNKPFEVTVNDVKITVLGTSFNVKEEQGTTEVIVESGRVLVSKGGRQAELTPGQKLAIGRQDSLLVPQQQEEKLYNYYRSRQFVCDNTPLWKLADVLSEAYQVNISIQRPELRDLPLDVTFSNESLDVILEIIKETFNNYNIRIVHTDNQIILQ